MAHHQQIDLFAQAQNNESLFLPGMLGVINQQRFLIIIYRLRFLKGYFMFSLIDLDFILVPFKPHHAHGPDKRNTHFIRRERCRAALTEPDL